MALYKYIAAIPGESAREVILEADNEKEALSKLRSRGAIPVRFLGDASQEAQKGGFSLKRSKVDTYEFTRLYMKIDARKHLSAAVVSE
jgi:type II secretory pathway component PulF